ncbi:tumor necrosis factor receptor superfamily member 9 isoform X1 [Hemicordylus capensis]|uniref:tumor necrosis factor receptor superfamily member 9 isoform X1 n=1 Tax=Hemicordylus capensis TaxID=884348 RepID=UPI0023021C8B|nr:tumor necrosis factor receptor superfamily member 9 isoform X1 [Hemicordylus capensis]
MGGSRGRRPPPAALLLLLLLLQLLLWSPGRVCGERPCPTATYRDHTTGDCKLCKTCDGIREYETKCSATANAVCRCVPKFRCGSGSLCELCECTEGQELTEQGCQSCPEGTFNDRPAGSCQPWKQCPDSRLLRPGTKTSDAVCMSEDPTRRPRSTRPPSTRPSSTRLPPSPVPPTKMSEMDDQLTTLRVALILALLLCVLLLLFFCFFFSSWISKRLPAIFAKLPIGQLAQEVEDCSYCYPEEEEGGSSSSSSSSKEAAALKGELLGRNP